jgi:acyl-CoA thioesterase
VIYHVDRAADGRSFATRLVRAAQGGTHSSGSSPCLYVAIISFQRRGDSALGKPEEEEQATPRYAERPPDLGGFRPDDAPRFDLLQQTGFQISNDEPLPANMHAENPFDWRLLPFKPTNNNNLSQLRAHGLVRLSTQDSTTSAAHLPSMALLSDQSLLELAILANWDSAGKETRSLAMSTTLNCHVSFHHAPAVVESSSNAWMICESRITSWGGGGA